MKIYAGIGSRETPPEICTTMITMATYLANSGWTLRSGHAAGADRAFELGAGTNKEIYIPWDGFQGGRHRINGCIVPVVSVKMESIARRFHPAWHNCSSAARLLHCRNVCQVLGLDCETPADMVVCWTPGGKGGGGTGQAIRIARGYGIPVFDIALEQGQNDLCAFLDQREAA